VATMMCDVMRALLVAVGRAEGPGMARRRSSIGSGGSGEGDTAAWGAGRGGRRHACMRAVAPLIGERERGI